MSTEKLENVWYLDDQRQEKQGVFILRRLLADESTQLLALSQKRTVERDGQKSSELDEGMYIKLKLALMITECPIRWNGMDWSKIPDIRTKATALGQFIEDDTLVMLGQKAKSMSRYDKGNEQNPTEVENLSGPQ